MTNRDTPPKPDRFPADSDLGKSIFPTFDVNVPMPRDTAVPGSYNKPAQQSSSGAAASKPAKAAE
jgi:hypothetical protein